MISLNAFDVLGLVAIIKTNKQTKKTTVARNLSIPVLL